MTKNEIAIIILSVLLAGITSYVSYTEGVKFYNAKINQAYTKGVVDVFSVAKDKGQVSVKTEQGIITLIEKNERTNIQNSKTERN